MKKLNNMWRNIKTSLPFCMICNYCRNRMFTFLKHDNINAKTHCKNLNSKAVSLFDKHFVSPWNNVDSENWHKYQNREDKKLTTIAVSEDSVATDNEIDGFTKVGLLCEKHIKNLLFNHLNINWLRNKKEYLEPLIRNHFEVFWSVKQNLILVFQNLNLQSLVKDYFVKTEINMVEVWFFITRRRFNVYKASATPIRPHDVVGDVL